MKSFVPLNRTLSAMTTPKSPVTTRFGRYQRNYSASRSRSDGLPGIDYSKLTITKSESPKPLQQNKDLVFGATFTGISPNSSRSYTRHELSNPILTSIP